MKLFELLQEYSSANPFVGIVSSIDLRIKEVEAATHASSNSSIFISSLKTQLADLIKFLESGINWVVPEAKLKSELHAALPEIIKNVKSAQASLNSRSIKDSLDHLFSARKIAVKRSHLTFGDIT